MARPKKEGMDYFPHDTDAAGDDKLEAMRALYGNDGYAFYFILLERIYRSPKGELDISNFTIRTTLIKKLGIPQEQFQPMLEAAFEIGMFDRETYEIRQCITSNGVRKRHNEVEKMRDKWRSKKDKEGENPPNSDGNTRDNEVIQGIFSGENESSSEFSPEKSTQRKEKKRNIKDIKNICAHSPDGEVRDTGYSPDFETFWIAYPRKTGKKAAYNVWERLIKSKIDPKLLIRCAEHYAADCQAKLAESQYVLHASTFLNPKNERYADYAEPVMHSNAMPAGQGQSNSRFNRNKSLLQRGYEQGERTGSQTDPFGSGYGLPYGGTY